MLYVVILNVPYVNLRPGQATALKVKGQHPSVCHGPKGCEICPHPLRERLPAAVLPSGIILPHPTHQVRQGTDSQAGCE